MILVDTLVWIEILRDKTGRVTKAFQERIGAEYYVLSRLTQFERMSRIRPLEQERFKLN